MGVPVIRRFVELKDNPAGKVGEIEYVSGASPLVAAGNCNVVIAVFSRYEASLTVSEPNVGILSNAIAMLKVSDVTSPSESVTV